LLKRANRACQRERARFGAPISGRRPPAIRVDRVGGNRVDDRDGVHFGPHPTAGGALTRLAYAQAKAAGIDPAPLLKKSSLTVSQIEDPAIRLRVRDQISFVNRVADEVHDDFLGFHLGLKPDLREIGWLYYVLASSETMGEALRRAARYSSIANEGLELHVADRGDVALKIRYVGVSRHVDRQQIEFIMTLLVRMCRQLTGVRLFPSHVRFIHRRDQVAADFAEFFGGGVEFSAAVDEASFAASIRDLPIVGADPYLNRLLTAYCEEALSRRPPNGGSFRSEVENAIVPHLPHGTVKSVEIARRLGTSQRTLARRLATEGASFSGVLESLRTDLAARYLADRDLSISEIAWLLGYREVSAFTHAFKRWTGRTPRDTRSRIA
jgi:AraC-like DNA-binding protein